jgi:hypothetical protein
VQLDARQRKFIWPDAERLDLEKSVTHPETVFALPP